MRQLVEVNSNHLQGAIKLPARSHTWHHHRFQLKQSKIRYTKNLMYFRNNKSKGIILNRTKICIRIHLLLTNSAIYRSELNKRRLQLCLKILFKLPKVLITES
jgi:hypothetical protein